MFGKYDIKNLYFGMINVYPNGLFGNYETNVGNIIFFGEPIGYGYSTILYKKDDNTYLDLKNNIQIKTGMPDQNPYMANYTIENLEPFSQYDQVEGMHCLSKRQVFKIGNPILEERHQKRLALVNHHDRKK